jgi:hypothetical protein
MKPVQGSEEKNAQTQLDAYPIRHTARTSAIAALRVARQRHDKKGISVKVEDLHEFLQANHLRVAGGDPDLGVNDPWTLRPWIPKIFVRDITP